MTDWTEWLTPELIAELSLGRWDDCNFPDWIDNRNFPAEAEEVE